jgi:predicted Zn-dependent protease with MMP-like domain
MEGPARPLKRSTSGSMRCDAISAKADCRGAVALDNGLVIEVEPGRFEDMVVTALDGLPEELGQLMCNVAVTVEHGPGPPGLLGLYEGIPLTSRTSQYAGVLPDRITIYRQAICAICRTGQEVEDQVRRTVIHEIAHHFGIDDNRLSELGW